MWGTVIGDLLGSVYEYDQFNKIKCIEINDINFESTFYSDDTVLTIAIIDSILNNGLYEEYLKEYGKKYMHNIPKNIDYFETLFSPGFTSWINGNNVGNSIGNGAMMRISGIGYLFDSEDKIKEEVRKATMTSHNNDISILCATIVALIIYYSRIGMSRDEIISKLNLSIKYETFKEFNMACDKTIDNCLYALFTSNSFDEAIKKVISYGGDTDTNAAIVGSMAESMFGIDEKLINEARKRIPYEFCDILDRAYNKLKFYQK